MRALYIHDVMYLLFFFIYLFKMDKIRKLVRETVESYSKISADELQKIQCAGNPSCDIIFDMNDSDVFTLTQVKIKDIVAPKGLSLQFYKQKELDEDVSIIARLLKALGDHENITPFVVDENNKIMDGLHRFVAYKYYYKDNRMIDVYKRVNF